MTLTYGSLFAGIGGFDLACDRAGMACAWQVEIDADARAVLQRHWPDVPKYPDVRECGAHNLAPVDVIVGGFPCQDLSVAGKRAGFDGKRSVLFFEMARIVDELRPAFLIWENVPGLLSSRGGADFWHVLNELDRIGYCGAWTGLDAQWFGVAQRRRRIFGVFAQRDIGAASCAEILSLPARLSGHPAPRREAREGVAATLRDGTAGGRSHGKPNGSSERELVTAADTAPAPYPDSKPFTLDWQAGSTGDTSFRGKARSYIVDPPDHTRSLTANRTLAVYGGNNTSGEIDVATACNAHGGTGRIDFESETFIVNGNSTPEVGDDLAFPLRADDGSGNRQVMAFSQKDYGNDAAEDVAPTLRSMNFDGSHLNGGGQVAIAFESRFARNGRGAPAEIVPPLKAQSGESGKGDGAALVFAQSENQRSEVRLTDVSRQLSPAGGKPGQGYPAAFTQYGIRRLTPVECCRLQGFPDDWNVIGRFPSKADVKAEKIAADAAKGGVTVEYVERAMSDSVRYRQLGNAVAVPVVEWIMRRLAQVLHDLR